MRVGTFFAALLAVFVLVAGSIVVAGWRGADLGDVSDHLFRRAADPSILKSALAWVWLGLGLAGVAAAFAAFVSVEGDESPNRLPHRRFPKSAPLLLLAGSLGVLWFLFAPGAASRPAAEARTPAQTPAEQTIDAQLAGGGAPDARRPEPALEDPPAAAAAALDIAAEGPAAVRPAEVAPVAPASEETALIWTYELPHVRDGDVVISDAVDRDLARLLPMDDPGGVVARMMCGKAWLAFAGSASEEGPPDRNAVRSRARAELLAVRAASWLDRHPNCDRPIVLALDLGQHVATGAGDPRRTAYQRQALLISRVRANPAERLTPARARSELEAFYADAEMRTRLLGARQFRSAPQIFLSNGP
jgi:hypothetical protein